MGLDPNRQQPHSQHKDTLIELHTCIRFSWMGFLSFFFQESFDLGFPYLPMCLFPIEWSAGNSTLYCAPFSTNFVCLLWGCLSSGKQSVDTEFCALSVISIEKLTKVKVSVSFPAFSQN